MKEKEKRKQIILDFIKEKSYVPMKGKEIASIFMVPKLDYPIFYELLSELLEEGKIQKDKKGRIQLLKEELLKGTFHGSQKGYGFVSFEEMDKEDVFIPEKNRKGAVNEDIVLVSITEKEKSSFHAEGKIIKIIKHQKNTLVGTFQKSRNFGFVVPDDRQFGSDIFISKRKIHGAKEGEKVVVSLTKYPQKGKKAEGEIIERLGKIDQVGVDILSLVKEYRVPYEFPEPVLEEAKGIEKTPIMMKKNRKDLREEILVTIDGDDSKDFDDAVGIKKLANGNYELNVSIADVSYYVKENSLLEEEAKRRGTSIYLLDRVIPMLPEQLSNHICSLQANEDRYAMTVIAEIDQKGNVVSSSIQKSLICVKERMTYRKVQALLDGKDKELQKGYRNYLPMIENMAQLAKILKVRRQKSGSLSLDIPETKITLDEKGKAVEIGKREITFANEIIEQFMLTANEIVAERFYWLEAPFIYRVHEEPDKEKVEELNRFLFNFGYHIKIGQDHIYSKSFEEVLEKIKGKKEEKIISNLILHTLKLAKYEKENKGHFGLASKYYCHFTSPIRRYPDLWIHRIISKYLESNYEISEEQKEKYEQLAEANAKIASETERIAQKMERDSIEMKKAEYMQDKIGNCYQGVISNVTSFGIFVELDNTVEGLIRFENLGKEYFTYDEQRKEVIGEKTKKGYKIGDLIEIRVIEANKNLRRISFEKVEKEDSQK